MSFSTAPFRRLLVSCSVAAGLLLATAGCRSAQSAYQFQPAQTLVAAPRYAPPAQKLSAETSAPTVQEDATPLAPPVAARPVRQPAVTAASASKMQLARQLPLGARRVYAAVMQPMQRVSAATDGAQATAEVGLGTTVLGVLGLIVGPISLIGLLIWGGPVWAMLLGLSVLAVLVAYLDPFG